MGLRSYYSRRIHSLKYRVKKKKESWRKYKNAHRDELSYFENLLKIFSIYGLLLSIVLSVLTSYDFSISLWLACGIGFYFIKTELPDIMRRMK